MTDFAVAHAADGEPRALTEACIAQLEGVEGHTLGFLYVTNQMAGVLDGVVELLKAKTGIEDWVGTVGFGVCASGVEYFDRPAMAVLTGRFGADTYRVIGPLLEPGGTAPGEGSEIAAAFGVVHGDPRNPHTVDIVAALAHARSVYLVGGLTAAETVFPQVAGDIAGDRLMFVRRDAESAAKDLRRMLADLEVRTSGTPKAGLYYSCVARGPNLFSDPRHEMIAIEQTFGDIPIAGFFGNGEISNDRVYGYTGVLTLFL